MHQRASPLMPVAVQCPLLGPLSGLQRCDMERLRKTCDAPPLAALFWEGQESRTPIYAQVYEEAVGAGTVFVLGETAWQEVCQFSRKLQKIVTAQLELGEVHIAWYGMAWHGHGMVWYGMAWHGMAWYGMVWYGMVWHGMVWYGMVWYGMVWYSVV